MAKPLGWLCVCLSTPLQAQDDDRALTSFVRAPVAAPRAAPVDAVQWETRLRSATSMGPRPTRQLEAGLITSARKGQDERVRQLLQRGATIDHRGEDGFTALGAAAFAGQRSTVRLLMLAGADFQRLSSSGQTALHLASLAGQLAVVDELLRLKVNVESLNRQRETALDVAANAGQLSVMSRLLEAGADATAAGRR
jgi:ankyrin repeat protein